MGHWYNKGDATMTDCDMRFAKKEGLLPSTTTILSILGKDEGLMMWIKGQIYQACYKLLGRTLSYDDFKKEAEGMADEQSKTAREKGSSIHDQCQKYLDKKEGLDQYPKLKLFLDELMQKYGKFTTEERQVNDLYGGCIDFYNEKVIGDYKTQSVKDGKPKYYPEWLYQLMSYKRLLREKKLSPDTVISVVINSNNPDEVFMREYDYDEQSLALTTWNYILATYYAIKFKKDIFEAQNATSK